ncbi:IclR family transcriptional regulator [Caldisalinibacter kiritimatiensis]|uniref:Glycerol operon regulatory protein n=1 Tax=Caldisalinibacter kiritimatiensis TaxID=1304284 RepID=R1CT93_9FIRM|nr:IclR family transcriptional regulator [Caldisalinibacter kiritimatiensis]EOC99913.1 Transcriptional regulator KdgR, KDG operon repressor [Caldisalinibacter kiritimatiensis]
MKEVVQSVDRALTILEVLSDYEAGLGITEISEKIQLHKSTIHRLLSTLIYKGYVEQDEKTSKYKLTLKLFELSNKNIEKIDVLSVAKPFLKELVEKANEAVHLVVLDGTDIVYIDKVESKNTIRMHSKIGKRSPVYCTAVGKSILAHLTDNEIVKIWNDSIIKKFTDYTITDLETLKKELELIKESGYAVDNEENELGVRCVGAPIFDYRGDVCSAISVSGPTMRITKDKVEELGKLVIEYSQKISEKLGYKIK